jgi:hypothetical protein
VTWFNVIVPARSAEGSSGSDPLNVRGGLLC